MANITDQFADPHFRAAVREVLGKGPDDTIYGTDNFASVDELDVSEQNIASLAGLEYFTSLRELCCYSNQLTSLPPLPATLTELDCDNNQLTSLPPLPAMLAGMSCGSNPLKSLPALPATLTELYCYINQLTSLPPLPDTLIALVCSVNELTELPPLPPTLMALDCFSNQLTSLPTLPPTLIVLDCSNNQLTHIALNSHANYKFVDVRNNYLKSKSAITGQSIPWDTGNFHFNPQKTP
ncbi:MAG: leucine-rich repeat domain-containing protein [Tannerellaceae bacterium]|jgi:Leucine-rich repeat (LRR) protein|nr:leucine-rich repeat domain-containing protein [Tannerellaceae bacterium]